MGYTGPLADKDRIFTNVYGFQSPDLKAARARGDWDDTAKLMQLGQELITVVASLLQDAEHATVQPLAVAVASFFGRFPPPASN